MERPPKQHEELKRHGEKAPPTGLDRPPPSIDELPPVGAAYAIPQARPKVVSLTQRPATSGGRRMVSPRTSHAVAAKDGALSGS